MEIGIFIALTTAIVEMIKQIDFLPSRFLPVLSLVIGGLFGYFAGLDFVTTLTIGLSASGFYSAQKAMRGN